MSKLYLGDSVYVDNDGYSITLTDRAGTEPANIIRLRGHIMEAVIAYWRAMEGERKRAKPTEPMGPEMFAKVMKSCFDTYDTEEGHAEADDLMCNVLESLGYQDGVAVFRQAGKWYA